MADMIEIKHLNKYFGDVHVLKDINLSVAACGRCQVNMIPIAEEVERRLRSVKAPITVAVMGCAVNGPGEARGADIGMASGRGEALLFANGLSIRKVPEERMVDELFEEIERRFG